MLSKNKPFYNFRKQTAYPYFNSRTKREYQSDNLYVIEDKLLSKKAEIVMRQLALKHKTSGEEVKYHYLQHRIVLTINQKDVIEGEYPRFKLEKIIKFSKKIIEYIKRITTYALFDIKEDIENLTREFNYLLGIYCKEYTHQFQTTENEEDESLENEALEDEGTFITVNSEFFEKNSKIPLSPKYNT